MMVFIYLFTISGNICDLAQQSLIWRGYNRCEILNNISFDDYGQYVINIQTLYNNSDSYNSFIIQNVDIIDNITFFVNVELNIENNNNSDIQLFIFEKMKNNGLLSNVIVIGTINITARDDQKIQNLDLFQYEPQTMSNISFSVQVYLNGQLQNVRHINTKLNYTFPIDLSKIYQYKRYNYTFLALNDNWEEVDNHYKNQYEYLLLLEQNILNQTLICTPNQIQYKNQCLNLQYCPDPQYVLSINKTSNRKICLPVCANLSEVPVGGVCQENCSNRKLKTYNSMGQAICQSCSSETYLSQDLNNCTSNCSIIEVEDNRCVSADECNFYISDSVQQDFIKIHLQDKELQSYSENPNTIQKCYYQCPRNYFYQYDHDIYYQCVTSCQQKIFQFEGDYYCLNDQDIGYLDKYRQSIFYYKTIINGQQYIQVMSQCPEGTRVNQATQTCEVYAIGLTVNFAIGIGGSLICIVVAMAICGWTYLNTDNDRAELQKMLKQQHL